MDIIKSTGDIIICSYCNGAGKTYDYSEVDFANDEQFLPRLCQCKQCNGSGRLIKTVTYSPYNNEDLNGKSIK